MKLKTLLITTIGAFVVASANAGDKNPVTDPPADLGASVAVGYNTHYIFRGINYGENQVTTQVDYTCPITGISIGAWYGNPTSGGGLNPGHNDELDLYANISHSFGSIDAWLGYTAYTYPEGGSSTNEVGTGIGTAVGPLDLALGAYYDFDIDGWYLDLTLSYSYVLCDAASLDLAAGISYSVDYSTSSGSDFNNVLLVVSVPVALTDRATLTPYIAGTLALDAIDGFQDDELFGGVSLSVAF